MPFSLFIAKRYLFSKSSNNAINIMTLIASGGIIVASAALFIVLSVFGGLKEYSTQFTNFTDPDIKLFPVTGKSFILSEDIASKLSANKDIAFWSAIVEENVVINSDDKNLLASLKGVDSNYTQVTAIDSMITKGFWFNEGSTEVVTGWGISNNLSFGVLDIYKSLSLYVPKPGLGQANSIKSYYNSINVNNVGLFDINETLNNEYIFSDIHLARTLLNYNENQTSAIEIKISENVSVAEVKHTIENSFKGAFLVKNREELNDALYKMLNTEHLAIYLIFTLVIIIALFNVIGTIIMMILDKKKSISTLYSLGCKIKTIKQIFFLQGSLMAIISGLIGTLLGVIIVWLQHYFSLVMLTPSLAYPVKLDVFNSLLVIVTVAVLGLLSSKIASYRITKDILKS